MIATTNKFDKIKKLCPALFRPGRLEPVFFGYVEEETMQDISMFYFGEKIKFYVPKNHKLPTSQVLNIALEFKKDKKTIKEFSAELNKLFSHDDYKN